MMITCVADRLALTAVLILLTRVTRGNHVWKSGPQVGPDGEEHKATGFRSEDGVQLVAVSVHCTENSMVVRARADLYGTGRLVTASELRLGPESSPGCGAVQREDTELVITAGLHECGAKLRVEDDSLIYANTLFHIPTLNHFGIVRSVGVAVPMECRYKRTHLVSSTSQSYPVSPAFLSSVPTKSVFSPQIRTDEWMSERSVDLAESEVISMVASVLSDRHSALKLFLDRCVVMLEPDTATTASCDLTNYYGCPADAGLAESNVSFLPGADGHVLRVKFNLKSLLGDKRQPNNSQMLITCWMKTADPVHMSSVNKACSYMGNSWCSVDGKHKVCECCDIKGDVFSQR
ncbi:zona pellucida sperm-binding protein 3-like isoform X1 [Tachysurus fulvidraco]|uniref:zona pellucida sperm-binding protein 3-like isoform X1 n=1 Tax=Tachysurus fulvidraco TaxID=1234273 RepID=UPI000F4EA6B9|nr:zona pellucida sperm-binding protein 3-like isoform X1 [Tachysurus fulvidraco]